jgi:hypothetical protein
MPWSGRHNKKQAKQEMLSEDAESMFLRNFSIYLQVHAALKTKDQHMHLYSPENLKAQN